MSEPSPVPDDFQPGEWLRGEGADTDIAVCTRVRLARNVQGFGFYPTMTADEATELIRVVHRGLLAPEFPERLRIVGLSTLDEIERNVLVERHLISREQASADRPRSVAVDDSEAVAVMINEEDHIRAQIFQSGFAVDAACQRAERLDDALMAAVPVAFSEEFGFLTACPTNVGTGLRVSVMLHLPGLVWADDIDKATAAVQKISLAVRGLYGEGSRAVGDFYQISNQITLGRSETQLVSDLEALAARILDYERRLRAILFEEQKAALRDRISRSLGLLRTARAMPTEGALAHLSNVRLGVHLGLLRDLPIERLNALTVQVQKAHIQALSSEEPAPGLIDTSERDRLRASWLRQRLAERAS